MMRTLFVAISLLAASVAYSQTSPQITISTEKVNVNGEVMYVHKVKSKETLYSIAKAYNVTIDELVRKNESLKAGLKEGSTIYIPSLEPAKISKPAETATKPTAETVAKTEAATEKKVDAATIKQYSKKKHTVKWYETIEDIAVKYSVKAEDIVAFNNLKSTLLEKKQVLYIPNEQYLAQAAAQAVEETPATDESGDTPATNDGNQQNNEDIAAAENLYNKEADILLILPLNLKDTIAPNSNFMDFYMGALIALEGSQKTNVTLVDQTMSNSIDEIISRGILENKDAVIGPVRSADMEKVIAGMSGSGIVFSPMDQNGEKLVEGNPNLIHIPPTAKAQQENIVSLFAAKCTPDKNSVIIYEKGGVDTTHLKIAERILAENGVECRMFSYGILEGREILDKMSQLMKPQTDNNVLVLSNSEAFVSDVVRNLNLIHTNPVEENRRKITLFGLPRWRNFETIEVDYFHRMNLHLSLPYFVDYSNKDVKDFLMKYRALFNCEPTAFAFQGFDVATIAADICSSFAMPHSAMSALDSYSTGKKLQLKHQYKRNGAGNGFSNTGTRNIVYNSDYTISEL